MNPISGTGKKKLVWQYIGEEFALSPDYMVVMHTTRHAGDGYEQAVWLARQGFDAVVAIGGDGTINEVARGLMHSRTALGIVPMGSGNGLARHLHIPMNYKKALELIKRFHTQPIDAAQINGKVFFCTAGIGFDALVGYLFNKAGTRGWPRYVGLSTKEFLQYAPQEYIIHIDDQQFVRKAFLVTFANASQWGNNAYVAPLAHCSDGKLDVVVWKNFPRVIAPFMLPRLFTKSIHKSLYVDTFRGKHIVVERSQADHVHFDGESCMMGKTLDIQVFPLALKVLM
jgi:YegS/Rv2252/BmrU family lipid kinase